MPSRAWLQILLQVRDRPRDRSPYPHLGNSLGKGPSVRCRVWSGSLSAQSYAHVLVFCPSTCPRLRMRLFRYSLGLAGLMGFANAGLMQRSLWERSPHARRLQDTPFKFDTTANMLSSMMDISEGGSKNLGRVLTSLQGQLGSVSADEESFNTFFDTFFIMKQTPAYKDAMDDGVDLSLPEVRSQVLTDAVKNMVAMSGNLLSDGVSKDTKTGMTGMEAKLLGLVQSEDNEVKELLKRNLEGDIDAIPTLQQMFFDKHYTGLDIEALKNDDFVDAQRAILESDPIFNHYVDDLTKEVIMDPLLRFGSNTGNVDAFYSGVQDLLEDGAL